ncbi:MAG: hypothetical protein K9N09_04295 [Candidatus Cloacimonetes bacterium]|nr:hypothetical protein [Candidatus Cloacimonadota bacterium]MCF7814844.1 hypothetical protein [Candidatus Cloacimonadota bacterium]MCF7867900.1 hypothetical protein [Candidatus Cloacimonadota bacterium]MCF7883719.1 hypothetical protein [Candidatus Cloacimonadota bacterium]
MIFLYLVLFFIALILFSTFMVASYLKQNGVKVDVLWLRFKFFYYLHQYNKITRMQNGRVGIYFYLWLISNIGLIATIIVMNL